MLSVLIPVFNFDIRAMVNQLHHQLSDANIDFEIICLDDASNQDMSTRNSVIEQLNHTTYNISSSNNGRIITRQMLAKQAKFDWLLFLDADVKPKSNDFIKNYLQFLTHNYQAIYGGFAYYEDSPDPNHILRWKYGKSKEQVHASIRNSSPYKITISANFLIQKSVFLQLNSKIDQKGYGYDNYFASLLKQHDINVLHINNEVYHLGLEPNETYLNKVETAVKNLLALEKLKAITDNENSLLITFLKLKRYKLNRLVAFFFRIFRLKMKTNLMSSNPSIFILQFYKLGYICDLDLN